jgi:hypothetical protein
MLTAIRNICSTIFHYDEHRLGHEESMEPDTNLYPQRVCDECRAKWRTNLKPVGDRQLCEFCRQGNAITQPEPHILLRFGSALARLIAPRTEKYSIINEPAWGLGHGEKSTFGQSK